jgi:hypothetical protein
MYTVCIMQGKNHVKSPGSSSTELPTKNEGQHFPLYSGNQSHQTQCPGLREAPDRVRLPVHQNCPNRNPSGHRRTLGISSYQRYQRYRRDRAISPSSAMIRIRNACHRLLIGLGTQRVCPKHENYSPFGRQ